MAAVSVLAGAPRAQQPAATRPAIQFRNVAEAAGVRFVHQHSPTPEKYFVESAPGGLAVFDYNGDGRPDIFFTNGAADAVARQDVRRVTRTASIATTAACGSPM